MDDASQAPRPDRSAAHRALQEALRAPDTFAAAVRDAGASSSPIKRLVAPLAVRLVHFFACSQVEWNHAVARTLEAIVRSNDEHDGWIGALEERLRVAEARIERLETQLRAAEEAEQEARRKLALVGIQLRELEERQEDRRPQSP
jgi:septal ring factor EnvC (AmiA/AmiB activator)